MTSFVSLRGILRTSFAALMLGTLAAGAARADVRTFTDATDFQLSTGATSYTGALPAVACCVASRTLGSITVGNPAGFAIGDYSSRLAGNELSIVGLEHLTVTLPHPVYAFGLDIVEPQFDPLVNAAFFESTFTFSLSLGGNPVGSHTFSPPNDTASFFGVWEDAPFDTVIITETTGDQENEFFGQMYASTSPNTPPVPEPESVVLMAVGLLALVARAGRRRAAAQR